MRYIRTLDSLEINDIALVGGENVWALSKFLNDL
jgi:hypothetical protein